MKKLFLLILISVISCTVFAQKSSQLKRLEEQRKLAMQEISNTDELLRTTNKTASSLLERIQLLANQISARQKVLELLELEVEGITAQQAEIEKEIGALELELNEKRSGYANAIDGMQANRQSQNKILFVLSGKSLTESYRRFHYLREFSTWVSQQADAIKEGKKDLEQKESELAESKYEKTSLLRQREREKENLIREELNYQKEAEDISKRQKELESVLADKKTRANLLNKEIEKLIAEEVARQEAKEKKARAAREKADKAKGVKVKPAAKPEKSTATKPSDPAPKVAEPVSVENLQLSKNFAANKGRLPSPITGSSSITGRFGTQYHKQWKVTTSSNGIDLQSQSGASARAVFEGEVTKVMPFPGYNNCVIVRHGDYYTFYANIRNLSVKQGEIVKTGQTLGTVYTDPDTNASQIHFQLWKGTAKLNPEPWLRR